MFIDVPVKGSEHRIYVGDDGFERFSDIISLPEKTGKVIIVTSPLINQLYGDEVRSGLSSHEVHTVIVDDGEANKNVRGLEQIWEKLAQIPTSRSDVLVALGGGVLGDLAGFAGATWNRGIPVIQVPTTLLAMVDSAIGGKTGMNLESGKNLVGAFHQPHAIVIVPKVLATLPKRERLAGLAEALKYGFISPVPIIDNVLNNGDKLSSDSIDNVMPLLSNIIVQSAQTKVDHITKDPFEHGIRAHLNYGHTIGHAIETIYGYGTFLHGEAVGLGMIAAADMAVSLNLVKPDMVRLTVDLLKKLGLPTKISDYGHKPLEIEQVLEVIRRDKKVRENNVRFILPAGLGKVMVVTNPAQAVIASACERIS